ncbi:MAG: aldo/keto reductase [bacterium]|nr:MAG: aldo/keto reductase [bacterium]
MTTKNIFRNLGKSELRVSMVGLGCWQFSQGKGIIGNYWKFLDDQQIKNIIKTSLDEGINWFDTAEVYGWGASEHAIAKELQELHQLPQNIVMATKWWPLFRTARSISRSIDRRLSTLHPYSIDLYQIHQPFSFSAIPAQMRELANLLDQRKIRYAGVSNFSARRMTRAQEELQKRGYLLVSNQVKYNLLDRKIESNGILETAKQLGITIIAYSPLAQGILSGKFHHNPKLIQDVSLFRKYAGHLGKRFLKKSQSVIEILENLSRKYGVTSSQIALNWLIHFHENTVVVIPGASTPEQARENAQTMYFTLAREDLDLIDQATKQFI